MNYINDDIKIDFSVPKDILDLMEMCEKFDLEDNLGGYLQIAEHLVYVACRDACASNDITKKQWELIGRRYAL